MTPGKPLALVTGASSGIGLQLARQFARHGFDLIATAETPALAPATATLQEDGAQVQQVLADLATFDGVEHLYQSLPVDRPVDAAALNAGVGAGGAFVDQDLGTILEIVDLNVRSTVHLAKRLVDDMVRRGEGRLLITSSIAAMMPGPFQAVYNASKSFLQSFAEALHEELGGTGVSVTALMPGPTDTAFFSRAHLEKTRIGRSEKDDPARVAEQGFAAMMQGRSRVVAGSLRTKAQAQLNKVLPDSAKATAHRRMAEPSED